MTDLLIALRRGALVTLVATLALALAACAPAGDGADDGTGGGATATVTGGTVEITADDLEFNVDTIEAPAGEAFTVVFTNLESAQHNWAIYTEENGEVIAQGEFIGQDQTDEIEVEALEPGEYFFVCDVHPQEMTGTVVVEG